MTQLTDSYDRKMDYLRISVTDRCNFRCQYCMPEDIKFQDKSHILTLEEMLLFAEACLQLGVNKVRVTGGEPLGTPAWVELPHEPGLVGRIYFGGECIEAH